MLTFAVKLTAQPGAMNDADVEALRSAGFSDRDILDIVEVVGYYAYANRIADGLGIETESWIPDRPTARGGHRDRAPAGSRKNPEAP